MSKARCIDNEGKDNFVTIGKVYSVLVENNGEWLTLVDNGGCFYVVRASQFQLLPDEPKAEWMQTRIEKEIEDGELVVDRAYFINVVTGHKLIFSSISRIAEFNGELVESEYADAFAALVGYTWKEG